MQPNTQPKSRSPQSRWLFYVALLSPMVLLPHGYNLVAQANGTGDFGLPLTLGAGLALIVGLLAFFAVIWERVRIFALAVLALAVLYVILWPITLGISAGFRTDQFAKLAERSQPLIEVIKRYEADQGRPPPSLAALVPGYVPSIPGTGMPAHPSYEYKVFPGDLKARYVWYNLGVPDPTVLPLPSLEFGFLGTRGHAALAFLVSGDGRINRIILERMPPGLDSIPFDPQAWRSDPSVRVKMISDLQANIAQQGKRFEDLAILIGQPDDTRKLIATPWELRVRASVGVLNWDVFVYWPSETYPPRMCGGGVERIGGWAYVHE